MMKHILVLLALLLSPSMTVMAQEGEKEETKVFDVAEQMPSFPGGPSELMKFLASNIKYPVVAEEAGIQGRVVVNFIVMPDGAIDSVKVVKSVDPSLDREAVRVVSKMPKWNPGMINGKPVKVQYTVPVTFRLETNNKQPHMGALMPSFPGGQAALSKFIAQNVKYPAKAKKKGIKGVVMVQVMVEVDGRLTEFKLKNSVDPLLDAEALRVAMKMPKWIPAKDKDGKAMRAAGFILVPFEVK